MRLPVLASLIGLVTAFGVEMNYPAEDRHPVLAVGGWAFAAFTCLLLAVARLQRNEGWEIADRTWKAAGLSGNPGRVVVVDEDTRTILVDGKLYELHLPTQQDPDCWPLFCPADRSVGFVNCPAGPRQALAEAAAKLLRYPPPLKP